MGRGTGPPAPGQAGGGGPAGLDVPGAGLPRDELVRQLGRAAGGAADLADALAALMSLLDGTGPPQPAPPPGPEPEVRDRRSAGGGPPARVPIRLPGGLFDDSVEAADHLLRVPGVQLVVDGYNVTMSAWPDLAVAEQRRRLVDALGELAARTSTAVVVVFDGADVGPLPVPAPLRSLVRVRFSPPDIEADDVVLDLVAHLPPARPVIVASSDNRVRDGAHRLGANLLHARQLAGVLPR